jgi:filamentous hemagglutinin family protein
LNKNCKVLWSLGQHQFAGASEVIASHSANSALIFRSVLRAAALGCSICWPWAWTSFLHAQTLPQGGQVVAGQGRIQTIGNVMTVNQSSERMVTDWQSFSIGQGSTVNFVQPSSSSVALNRVLGTDVSVIQGALKANGQVFLVNPNGVLFSKGAQVNVGGIVASTLNITAADFMAGNYRFEGESANAIVNQGNIAASSGGTVALIAARISNIGQIQAERGHVLMGAGRKVKLDLGGPVKIEVEEGAIDALIEQGGGIRADGGLVYLTAKAAGQLATTVINHSGLTEARTLSTGESGQIYLMGGMEKDRISVGGKFDAGAPFVGHGGFIETSAANVQINPNVQINTLAASGQTGTWLIDPVDFTISSGSAAQTNNGIGATTLSTALNTSNVTIQTSSATGGNGDIFVNAAVTKTSGTTTTLTLAADRSVLVTSPGSISGSLNSPLNIVLAARARGGGQGQIIVRGNVRSFGGNITIGGGDTSASGYAIGVLGTGGIFPPFDQNTGVQVSNAVVDATADGSGVANAVLPTAAVGGNITIRGQGSTNQAAWGLHMIGGGSVITGGSGNIDITGQGGNGTDYYYALGSAGVVLESNAYIKANTGNLTIKGYAGSGQEQHGIVSSQSNKLIGTNGMLLLEGSSLMMRDGTLTVHTGQASDIKMPILGCTGQYCVSNPGFTKAGPGILNLWGNAENWDSNRPANTLSTTRNAVFTDASNAVNIVGITSAQALFAFSTLPATTTEISQSTARISLTPMFNNIGGPGSLLYYNGSDYSLNSYWSSNDVFGRALTQGTDYSFVNNSNAVSSFKNAGSYSITLNLLNTSTYTFGGNTPTATFTVTPKPLSVIGLSATDKVYDGNVSSTISNWGTVSTGVGNETLILNRGSASFLNAGAGIGKTVSAIGYSLADGSNGGLAGNYQLTSTVATTTANIEKAPITVTADNISKMLSDADPALTYQITSGALVAGDNLLGSLTRSAGNPVGRYTIDASGLFNENYQITANNGTLTITSQPAAVVPLPMQENATAAALLMSSQSALYAGNIPDQFGSISQSSDVVAVSYNTDDGLSESSSSESPASEDSSSSSASNPTSDDKNRSNSSGTNKSTMASQTVVSKTQPNGLVLLNGEQVLNSSSVVNASNPSLAGMFKNAGRNASGSMRVFIVRGGLNTNFELFKGQLN